MVISTPAIWRSLSGWVGTFTGGLITLTEPAYAPNCTVFMMGDLVQVYAIDVKGEHGPIYTGIYIGWDNSDNGWIVKTEGKLEVFPANWWICKKVGSL